MDKEYLLERRHDWAVCIDSDGCLMDNMELKHKECFCPATVNVWNFQQISKYVRQEAEFTNLYSRSRGWNRFPALVRTIDLTFERPEVRETGVKKPDLTELEKWIEETPELSATALAEYSVEHPDMSPVLKTAAKWSLEVDDNIKRIVRNIAPFPGVKDAIIKVSEFADVIVVSATPQEALDRELKACGVADLVSLIMGQEAGTKRECIRRVLEYGYAKDRVLKVGDAPSDYKASQDNNVLFFPIIPGEEAKCWALLRDEYALLFKDESYKGNKMNERISSFLSRLPENHQVG